MKTAPVQEGKVCDIKMLKPLFLTGNPNSFLLISIILCFATTASLIKSYKENYQYTGEKLVMYIASLFGFIGIVLTGVMVLTSFLI